ncbi:MAG: lysophospholipid acyltransferase family protein [Ardenticatenales bacterium]|nr:lysophospholipid acyltransferase family protein [Ardenticatenales bacterium]
MSTRMRMYHLLKTWIPKIPLKVSYGLANVGGDLLWLFAKGVRANIEDNQRHAMRPGASDREVSASAREVLRNLAKIYVDEFRIPALSEQEIRDSVIVHGMEYLEAARAEGKGIVLTSAHYGTPHMVGQLLTVLGYPTTVVVEHVQPEEMFEFMCDLRSSHGLRLLPIDKPLIGLIRTLRKENGIVALVVDRNVTGTGITMPFLGEETNMADGAVQLALRTGSPLLLAYCRRRADNRYEAVVEPPIELPDKPADMDAAAREGTAKLVARLEAFIREQPDQWVMTVPIWKQEAQVPVRRVEASAGDE